MNRLREQIRYSKFIETNAVTLDLDYAERLLLELEELTKTPTLSECIKEWVNKGFSVNVRTTEIFITNSNTVDREEDEIGINIRLDLKTIFYMNDVELSFDLHNLLSKTLRALENNNETK